MKTFTTGELAKLCNVSVRTVQYYDKENIIKPSELSEGGRRIYSEEDVEKFRCVCLYKELGFSLEEIKKVMASKNPYGILSDMITSQKARIDEQVHDLQQLKKRLDAIDEEITSTGKTSIKNIEDMDELLVKKDTHRKTDIMTYIFIGCYMLILVAGFPIAVSYGGIGQVAMFGVALLLLAGLVYYHSVVNWYVCTKCHQKFSIGFWTDLFSLNGAHKGKYLKCPSCSHRGWFKETYPE